MQKMIKPKMLKWGDTVAVVSLSSGMADDEKYRHRYELGKRRLEEVFGLNVVAMPHALMGSDYVFNHPKARAQDWMDAFADPEINGIISCIGGDDTVRLLPHIDYDVIARNPKVFLGFSDTTVNHFMMRKAGVVSYYGPSILAGFAENAAMHDYTVQHVRQTLFERRGRIDILPSPAWTSEFLDWADASLNDTARKMNDDARGHVVLQGGGEVSGVLLGGCADVFPLFMGTDVWPQPDEWDGAILFLETSEECPPPNYVRYTLRNMAAQGIIDRIAGVLFAKPMHEKYYDEYNEMLKDFFGREAGRPGLPVMANVSFGHNAPMCVLPCGVAAQINCGSRRLAIIEPPVE